MDEQQVQDGQKWLVDLLKLSGLPTQVQADLNKVEIEESCWLTLDADHTLISEQVQALIGVQGAALDALQYLANTILNMGRGEGEQLAFTLELSGYRARRQLELKELSDLAAQKVLETQEEYEMSALSSAERRLVHTYLKSFDDLETYSRGREPDRRLVVRLAQPPAVDPSKFA
ncbi:MAG: RNA-binding protein [Timaviella obliquedivisa GSE-PSE-MK23-08B]|jgi:spoIIIJ-associated protein|nr:RNA-binding protein [Timaviella obliquedivisa GSE-PSE-MK23-08B]